MIEKIKELLAEHGFSRAVIIDDAYDESPKPGDVEDQQWDRFFDDITGEDEQKLAAAYGAEAYEDEDVSELRRNSLFISTVWKARQQISATQPLFDQFSRDQLSKREQLEPLEKLLAQDLGLTCSTFGRDETVPIADVDIMFIDLFLGVLEKEEALKSAIDRVKTVIDQRRQKPPIVVLLSASPKLEDAGPRLRDEARLLGCQFCMVPKRELTDTSKMAERLRDLVSTYPDSNRINTFLLAWEMALDQVKTTFLRSIRALDLRDYANLHTLVLAAEGEPVGDYVLDLYDLHLHHLLEGEEGLIRAAVQLNAIQWSDYPPAQFMPSSELIDMMDGALFVNETRTRIEAEVTADDRKLKLGDVFLAPSPAPPPEAQNAAPGPLLPQHAFVTLSQACDLQHGNVEQALLMRGDVRPYTAKEHNFRDRTPVMKVSDAMYAISWDVKAPETWRLQEIPEKVALGFRRVRRFRTPFALQLQQEFIGNLGRVGTLSPVPARFPVAVRMFLRTREGNALLLVQRAAADDDAVYLMGRTADNKPLESLFLSDSLRDDFRRTLRDVPTGNLPPGGQPSMATLRDDPAFYQRFKRELKSNRAKTDGVKPFRDTAHDVVQIVTRKVCVNGIAPADYKPIIVEVDLE